MGAPRLISAHSFDIDGCIFPDNSKDYSEDEFVALHKELLEKIVNTAKEEGCDKFIELIGSNRQSVPCDFNNATHGEGLYHGKSYPRSASVALNMLHRYFVKHLPHANPTIDPYLLADCYNNLRSGTTYNELGSTPSSDGKAPDTIFDLSKLTLLYVQMHKLASENPNAQITYHFYDDRGEILSSLHDFFTNNPDLVPKNLTLKLNFYAPNRQISEGFETEIKGTGHIDDKYEDSVKKMVLCAAGELINRQLRRSFTFENGLTESDMNQISHRGIDVKILLCAKDNQRLKRFRTERLRLAEAPRPVKEPERKEPQKMKPAVEEAEPLLPVSSVPRPSFWERNKDRIVTLGLFSSIILLVVAYVAALIFAPALLATFSVGALIGLTIAALAVILAPAATVLIIDRVKSTAANAVESVASASSTALDVFRATSVSARAPSTVAAPSAVASPAPAPGASAAAVSAPVASSAVAPAPASAAPTIEVTSVGGTTRPGIT